MFTGLQQSKSNNKATKSSSTAESPDFLISNIQSSRELHPLNNSSGKSNGSTNESDNSSSDKRGNEQSTGQMGQIGRTNVNMTDDSRDNSSYLLMGEIGDDYDDLVDSDLTFFQDSIFTFVSWWKV